MMRNRLQHEIYVLTEENRSLRETLSKFQREKEELIRNHALSSLSTDALINGPSDSIQPDAAPPRNPGDGTIKSPLPLEIPPSQTHPNDQSIESNPTTNKKRKRPSRKEPKEKDPVKFKHKCNICGDRFTRSTTLREHTRTHYNERPFDCPVCHKSFTRRKDRNRHLELHTGERNYECGGSHFAKGGCHQKFARSDQLVAHFRSHHE